MDISKKKAELESLDRSLLEITELKDSLVNEKVVEDYQERLGELLQEIKEMKNIERENVAKSHRARTEIYLIRSAKLHEQNAERELARLKDKIEEENDRNQRLKQFTELIRQRLLGEQDEYIKIISECDINVEELLATDFAENQKIYWKFVDKKNFIEDQITWEHNEVRRLKGRVKRDVEKLSRENTVFASKLAEQSHLLQVQGAKLSEGKLNLVQKRQALSAQNKAKFIKSSFRTHRAKDSKVSESMKSLGIQADDTQDLKAANHNGSLTSSYKSREGATKSREIGDSFTKGPFRMDQDVVIQNQARKGIIPDGAAHQKARVSPMQPDRQHLNESQDTSEIPEENSNLETERRPLV